MLSLCLHLRNYIANDVSALRFVVDILLLVVLAILSTKSKVKGSVAILIYSIIIVMLEAISVIKSAVSCGLLNMSRSIFDLADGMISFVRASQQRPVHELPPSDYVGTWLTGASAAVQACHPHQYSALRTCREPRGCGAIDCLYCAQFIPHSLQVQHSRSEQPADFLLCHFLAQGVATCSVLLS